MKTRVEAMGMDETSKEEIVDKRKRIMDWILGNTCFYGVKLLIS